jgi:hypothetical protein
VRDAGIETTEGGWSDWFERVSTRRAAAVTAA